MQVILVYLQPFRRNSLWKCVSQLNIAKNLRKSSYFGGSKSVKLIDVDISKKLIASACYDKQHVLSLIHI